MSKKTKIGLQVFSVYKMYQENPFETLKLISDCGYEAVELIAPVTMPPEELKKMLDDLGLECCGWHSPWDYMSKPDLLEMFAAYNRIIGNKYLISMMPWDYMNNKDKWEEGCAKLNEIAAQLKKYGMYTGMHVSDKIVDSFMDFYVNNTVDDVVVQLDTGNTFSAGLDPVAILKKYKNRYQTVHIKPYSPTKGHVPIGEDDTDWAEVVKYLKEYGNTDYYIIEHEVPNAKVEIKTCIDNFKKYL